MYLLMLDLIPVEIIQDDLDGNNTVRYVKHLGKFD